MKILFYIYFFKIYVNMCVWVSIYAPCTCRYLWRPEKGVKAHGTGLKGSSELSCVVREPVSSAGVACILNSWAVSPVSWCSFFLVLIPFPFSLLFYCPCLLCKIWLYWKGFPIESIISSFYLFLDSGGAQDLPQARLIFTVSFHSKFIICSCILRAERQGEKTGHAHACERES